MSDTFRLYWVIYTVEIRIISWFRRYIQLNMSKSVAYLILYIVKIKQDLWWQPRYCIYIINNKCALILFSHSRCSIIVSSLSIFSIITIHTILQSTLLWHCNKSTFKFLPNLNRTSRDAVVHATNFARVCEFCNVQSNFVGDTIFKRTEKWHTLLSISFMCHGE